MAILLGILKIIGIVVLTVIGIAVLSVLCLLFLPVHLQLYAACEKQWMVRLKVLAFFRFFQFRVEYLSGDLIWSVRAFWGKCVLFPKDEDEPIKNETEIPVEHPEEELWDEEELQEYKENLQKELSVEEPEGINAHEKRKKQRVKRDRGKSIPIDKKLEQTDLFNLTPEKIRAVRFLTEQLIWYLKKIKPVLAKADAVYSLGDPADTGELTGVLSLWPSVYGENVRFCPDFESDRIYFQGYVQCESRLYGIHLLRILLKIYFNKDCKKLFDF